MSGPKSSRYTLSAEQLRRIHEEQERLRKELEEKARKARENREAREYLVDVRSRVSRFIDVVRSYESKAQSINENSSFEAQTQLQQFYSKAQQVDSICQLIPEYNHTELMRARRMAEQLFSAVVTDGEAFISSINEWILQQKIHYDEKISEGMKVSFASVGLVEEKIDPIRMRIEIELEELLLLDVSEDLIIEVKRAVEQFKSIEDTNACSNFMAITLEPLRKRCISEARFREANAERYRETCVRYSTLCTQLDEKEIHFEFSPEGLKALEKAVSDCEQRTHKDAEQKYISDSIDEVMLEMGYQVIGRRSVRKKTGRTFKSKLLTYEDGTVVNVTESSNGQITMEIGGMDDRDRLPDANERVALQKTMEMFCGDFKEIERRLSERGVVLDSRLSMAPPEEAYAQIINYTDYELVDDFQTVITKKKKTVHSQKKRQLRND